MNNHPLSNLISGQELLEKIANEHGTPLYVYSEERLNENINRLSSAIGNSFEKHHIYYAVKANSNTHIISTLKKVGIKCPNPEGRPKCDWIIVDVGSVLVHLFRQEIRDLYNLEKLWEFNFDSSETKLA